MYWEQVLNEVLNKENPAQKFAFTSISENSTRITSPTKMVKEPLFKKPRGHLKKFYLQTNDPQIYFTLREVQTLHYLVMGKTLLETAVTLNLSRRTVEFYLKNMKSKLNCRFKSELLAHILRSDLKDLLGHEAFELTYF